MKAAFLLTAMILLSACNMPHYRDAKAECGSMTDAADRNECYYQVGSYNSRVAQFFNSMADATAPQPSYVPTYHAYIPTVISAPRGVAVDNSGTGYITATGTTQPHYIPYGAVADSMPGIGPTGTAR